MYLVKIIDRSKIAIPHVDLEEWRKRHPRSYKKRPDFYVDFNEEGERDKDSPYAWTITRKLVLERDGYRCRFCGKDQCDAVKKVNWEGSIIYYSGLEVHHIIPKKDGGTDHPANLITLCWNCHKRTFRKRFYNYDPNQRRLIEF
ncbi:MAG: hypothetical protein DRN25_00870 [Thermoplasmata archaeon]|nr:MAG: hypothetical protein DRN25_00870 [Thermoplasmata archaeon]